MTCPADAALAQFVDGSAPPDAGVLIEEHLDRCASCRQIVSATVRQGPAPGGPSRLGRYELQAPLGAGAMGVVYAAFDPDLDRRVAVKVLAPHATTQQSRLAREARALARISHPNVVPVHDVGVADDQLFIAMELVDGHTLRAHVAAGSLTERERVALLVQAGRGLAAAHAAGVIHRDFKPDNIFVGRDGRVRVGDFGLAAAGELGEAGTDGGDVAVTRTGALLGTPAYMAPETLAGTPSTVASDQFALCVTAWEIAFGTRPFQGKTVAELAEAMQRPPAEPPRGDRRIAAVLRRGLAVDPAARYPDVTTLVDALERAGRRPVARWIAGSLAIAALGVTAGVQLLPDDPASGAAEACARSDDPIAAVWSPTTRGQLARAFAQSGYGVAAETADATARAIDRWVGRWSEERRATCEDRRAKLVSDDVSARREHCLQTRTDELAGLLRVLGRADATTVQHAVAAVGSLPGPETCKAAAAIASISPERRADHERARKLLAEGHALGYAAHYQEAAATLAQVPADLPDPALLAAVELERGIIANALGDQPRARDHLSRAVARADDARDDQLRARALIETLSLVGDEDVKLDEAARIKDQARAAVARAGSSAELRADLAAAIGDVAIRQGKFEDALRSFDEAIAANRARQPLHPVDLADVLNSAAGLRGELGDYPKSLALSEEARTLAEGAVGANHPLTAAILGSMAQSLHFSDRTPEAIAAARRSLEIYERVFGPEHPRVGAVLGNLAVLHSLSKRYDEAIALFDRARRITEARNGAEHADNGTNWLNLASTRKAAGQLDAAATGYQRAIEIWERALGPEHVELARPLVGLADVELQLRAPARALPLLERALALRTANAANPSTLAHTRFLLAQALRALGRDPARVATLAKQARDAYAADEAADEVAEIDAWLKTSGRASP